MTWTSQGTHTETQVEKTVAKENCNMDSQRVPADTSDKDAEVERCP